MRKISLYCIIAILLIASGCAAASVRPASLPGETQPMPSPSPSPVPAPGQTTVDEAPLSTLFCVEFSECGFAPCCDASPAAAMANRAAGVTLVQLLRTRAQAACGLLRELYPGAPIYLTLSVPSWQWLCGLHHGYGAKAGEALQACLRLSATCPPGGGVTLEVAWANPIDDATLRAGDRTSLFSAHFMTCYLTTAYDATGQERAEQKTAPLNAVPGEPLFFPLPGREKRVKDNWYDDRTKKTRYHMGTDIKAREGTPILACRGGQVLLTGYHDIPGYYVVLRDAAGYEYHYYHMAQLADFLAEGEFVSAGALIGHVGDTGNSDTAHLHLSIISPRGEHVNPYFPMKNAAQAARANQ